MWKEYFYYTRRERRGVILIILLMALFIGSFLMLSSKDVEAAPVDEDFAVRYAQFIASLEEVKKDQEKSYPTYQPRTKVVPVLEEFDPNQADSLQLVSLGLPSWMASNILNYRSKGGQFRTPESFRKVYGLTDELYASLLPYIRIDSTSKGQDTLQIFHFSSIDSVRIYKFSEVTLVDINRTDTTELKKIPGIGSGIAKLIITYRENLGGYYAISQLEEINLKSELLNDWFNIDISVLNTLSVNKVSLERLRAHPYISYYQAKVIVEHRRKRGNLRSMSELSLYEEFSENDLERLSYYMNFEE